MLWTEQVKSQVAKPARSCYPLSKTSVCPRISWPWKVEKVHFLWHFTAENRLRHARDPILFNIKSVTFIVYYLSFNLAALNCPKEQSTSIRYLCFKLVYVLISDAQWFCTILAKIDKAIS